MQNKYEVSVLIQLHCSFNIEIEIGVGRDGPLQLLSMEFHFGYSRTSKTVVIFFRRN